MLGGSEPVKANVMAPVPPEAWEVAQLAVPAGVVLVQNEHARWRVAVRCIDKRCKRQCCIGNHHIGKRLGAVVAVGDAVLQRFTALGQVADAKAAAGGDVAHFFLKSSVSALKVVVSLSV